MFICSPHPRTPETPAWAGPQVAAGHSQDSLAGEFKDCGIYLNYPVCSGSQRHADRHLWIRDSALPLPLNWATAHSAVRTRHFCLPIFFWYWEIWQTFLLSNWTAVTRWHILDGDSLFLSRLVLSLFAAQTGVSVTHPACAGTRLWSELTLISAVVKPRHMGLSLCIPATWFFFFLMWRNVFFPR